jgi:hypothetical protein
VPSREQDVLGLDVAVDHVVAVRIGERVGNLPADLERVIDRQLLLPIQPVAEGFAFDIGHDVEEEAASLPRVEQRQDVGMIEPAGELDLPQESLGA